MPSTTNHDATSDDQVGGGSLEQHRSLPLRAPAQTTRARPPEWKLFVLAIFSQKFFIAGVVAASLLLGWIALLVLPRSYDSESRLLVRVGRESIALDPTATTSQTLMLQKTQEEEVNSAIEVLRSRRIAERVVDKIGAENIIAGILPQENGDGAPKADSAIKKLAKSAKKTLYNVLLALGIKDDLSDRELAIMNLSSSTDISAERGTTVVTIEASAETPEMAQAIAQTTAEEFIDENLSITHNSGASAFFVEQVEEANQHLENLSTKRVEYLQDRDVVDVAAKRNILVDQLGVIEGEIITTQASLEQVTAEISDVEQKLKSMPEEIVASKNENSGSTWSQMRQAVYALEIQEKELAAVYADGSPRLQRVREQLAGAQAILSKFEGGGGVDQSTVPNPMLKNLEEVLQQLDTRKVGLQAALEKKQSQEKEVEEQIHELLNAELEIDEMDRDIAAARTRLEMLRTKLEEARIGDELQGERISNLSLFQPATFVERASSPNKKLLALGCLVMGLFGGVSLAFVREFKSRKLRTSHDAAARMPTEMVAQIGAFGRKQDPLSLMQDIHTQPEMVAEIQSIVSDIQTTRPEHDKPCLSVGVLALGDQAGTTSIAATAASVAARGFGLDTVLVDADGTSDSCLTDLCHLQGTPGLLEVARGETSFDDCLQAAAQKRLSLVGSSRTEDGEELWLETPKAIAGAIDYLGNQSDLVFVDLPGINRCEGVFAVARQLDYVIVVVQSRKANASEVTRLVNRLSASGYPRVALVVNKCSKSAPSWLTEMLGLTTQS